MGNNNNYTPNWVKTNEFKTVKVKDLYYGCA